MEIRDAELSEEPTDEWREWEIAKITFIHFPLIVNNLGAVHFLQN